MQIQDCEPGTSYACQFRTTTFLNDQGQPVRANLAVGQAHPGTPGAYKSVGIIEIRDRDQQLVKLRDTRSNQTFVVHWDDCWDVDTIEWVDRTRT